jgi:hypothetical protein
MKFSRNFAKLPAVVLAASLGVAACADEPMSAFGRPGSALPIALELSSARAAVGSRVAVAVTLGDVVGSTGGIQGDLEFDPSRLKYIGQSPVGDAIAIVNDNAAANGELVFTAFNPRGVEGRVAMFVFETKSADYASSLSYEHKLAVAGNGDLRKMNVQVRRDVIADGSLSVPTDARDLSIADWAVLAGAEGTGAPIALRPGEYRLNLVYGDVDFDASVGLFDYLGVANAAVGNDPIIVNTDGPATDVDLVIAGNVFPENTAGACGTEADGSRVLDLFDYLAIANEAVGLNEACVGDVIPGRGALPTTRQSINATSSPDLTVGAGETMTLTNDRVWQLEGILRVQDGGTLIVQAGTRVEGLTDAAETQAIFVERGGDIFVNGTLHQPVVFTCTAEPKFKGCWGGIFVAGRGTVNLGDAALGPSPDGGCNQRPGEGNAPVYGGCNPADNSGSIRYAIIEYGGKVIGANNELNGLTLGGVGSGTVVEYVQIHGGTDDGIEFFGGDLSTNHLVLTGNDDDGFDVSFGLRGTHQFVIIQSDAGASNNDSKAIEADGNEPAPGTNALPRTSPALYNFTIIGNLALRTQNSAIHLRRGSGVKMYNSLVAGYEIGVDFDDALTCDSFGDGPVDIRNTTFIDVPNLGQNDGSDPLCGGVTSTTEGEEEFIRLAGKLNVERTGIASVLVNAFDTNLPDWRMLLVGGQPAEGNTFAATGGAVATNYRGAVAPVNTAGDIPWYAGWTRPFQSAIVP